MITDSFHTFREIIEQPRAWQTLLDELPAQAAGLQPAWLPDSGVVFTGCGSPYFLARTAAALFQSLAGRPGRAHPASDLLFFPETVYSQGPDPLLVAISRSGETTELLGAIENFRARAGAPVIGITCYEGTSLARQAALTLVARAAAEQSMAQTRSFTSMLLAAQALCFALAGQPLSPGLQAVPALGAQLLDQHAALGQRLGEDLDLERFYFLGSGPFYGLAGEAMLKLKEMSLTHSEAYHFLEFRHGPMSMITPQTLVVGLLSAGALPHEVAVLTQMRAMGARVLALTPVELAAGLVDDQVVLPPGLTDLERGPLYLPVLQLLAYSRAVAKGLNPDAPHNLTAIVKLDLDHIGKQAVAK